MPLLRIALESATCVVPHRRLGRRTDPQSRDGSHPRSRNGYESRPATAGPGLPREWPRLRCLLIIKRTQEFKSLYNKFPTLGHAAEISPKPKKLSSLYTFIKDLIAKRNYCGPPQDSLGRSTDPQSRNHPQSRDGSHPRSRNGYESRPAAAGPGLPREWPLAADASS